MLTEKDSSNTDEGFTNDEQCEQEPCAIVGIGASAGGLDAFTRLLEKLPIDTGMAFVLVQHLEPNHKSALTDILSKNTAMTVSEVENNMVARPNHVYIIPPNKTMSVSGGILNLVPRENTAKHLMSIDYFLESLAKDQGSKAIGVILSGTATDGSRGLKEVKNVGGITFAQKPQTAKFDSMPLNAITTGVVDYELPPEDIAYELAEIARSSVYDIKTAETHRVFTAGADELKQIFTILRKTYGTNFSEYRELTIQRRTLRRMVLHKIEKLGDYVDYLRQNPVEVGELYQDLLINVTSFFRDPEAFETLKSLVFPAIMKNRAPGEPVRIWVAGCSTGEEAYSIAIVLMEFLGDDAVNTPIQIFASDINDMLIEKARAGIYPESINADVSLERLRRFFVKVDGGYQINKICRDLCIFARHEMSNDPPFSRMNLICCRNVIIYFGSAMKKRLFPVFHYSLKEKGFLFLGASESVGSYANLFNLADKKHKLYSKKAITTPLIYEFSASEYVAASIENRKQISRTSPNTGLKFNVIEEADRIVLDQYAPAGVIVNSDLEIIQFRGRTGAYLEPAAGRPSLKLFKMVRDGLSLGLLSAINQAK
ncbi:MAG: chemotaxis protein CheB, partial [Clostridiales bacterium]|nr:chemotaxis protein CheB [Clostridiales bacterium]